MEVCMRYYIGDVYSGGKNIGSISGMSIINLKRKASQLCNQYYNVIDEMKIRIYDDDNVVGGVSFLRINKKSPNNEIKRGKWS